jgi:hypothetical protein
MLARPWPTSSWLGSRRCLVLAAMALAMEMASMKPTREITRAAESRLPQHVPGHFRHADRGQAFRHLAHHFAATGQFQSALWRHAGCASDGRRPWHAWRKLALAVELRWLAGNSDTLEDEAANGPVAAAIFVLAILELQAQQVDLVVERHHLVGEFAARLAQILQFGTARHDLVADFLDAILGTDELGRAGPWLPARPPVRWWRWRSARSRSARTPAWSPPRRSARRAAWAPSCGCPT